MCFAERGGRIESLSLCLSRCCPSLSVSRCSISVRSLAELAEGREGAAGESLCRERERKERRERASQSKRTTTNSKSETKAIKKISQLEIFPSSSLALFRFLCPLRQRLFKRPSVALLLILVVCSANDERRAFPERKKTRSKNETRANKGLIDDDHGKRPRLLVARLLVGAFSLRSIVVA